MYLLVKLLLHFHSLRMSVPTSLHLVVVARFEQFYGYHIDSFSLQPSRSKVLPSITCRVFGARVVCCSNID
jgi:hypothetical protein